jgi:integrating conjugative element protein (TIGR03761 family)
MLACSDPSPRAFSVNPENKPQPGFGALRSAMTLTLHTHDASRIWWGRPDTPENPRCIGLPVYVDIMNKMKRGAQQDDPFSDWWMVRIEQKAGEIKARLQTFLEEVDHLLANIEPTLDIGDNASVHPVKLPLHIGSPLGFAAIHLITAFDCLVRRLRLAHHIALMSRRKMERQIGEAAYAVRELFLLAQGYQYSGTTREDYRAQNAAWAAAVEKFGMPPQGVITGDLRSRFAPALKSVSKARAGARTPLDGGAEAAGGNMDAIETGDDATQS